ncbi:hypothetical protein DFJ58DRAFT_780513 [Suillus subalutaceus]|uniref:uncharacterized protein n=1 Tax=Suillus subalutaceus TaxID=48586 RepID=UPI001B874BBE|nr:uncharacterized protein DFJ58DRAFT_780513 [Suillus subalutaceus]KAG1859610.1 hypothetical protein DFJ58DRAFT_780513 [Suillus subalutaceus]
MERSLTLDSSTSEKYFRIASISIAFYDQPSIFRISLACVLFILIRYVSVLVMILSNYGYFATGFTQQTCQNYYLAAPAFKVMQSMISQVILGVRTFNIARRDRRIGIALLLLYLISISVEWFTDLYHRIRKFWPMFQPLILMNHSCTSADSGKTLSAWLYYLAAMLYDLVMLTVSTTHLLRYNPLSSKVGRLVRVLIYDGIGYFIVLSATNLLNLVLYHTTDSETQEIRSEYFTRASLGYAVTWIMSQRILINIREMSEPDPRRLETVVVARPTLSSGRKNVVSGLRSQFESKGHSKNSKSPIDPEFPPTSSHNGHPDDVELDIRVCVERSVKVDYDYERSSPWDKPTMK